jgi:glycosyltransferase involved in cell wall biosynthesis
MEADSATTQPTQPLISVVMATYNRSNILGYAIQTVLAQTHTNWELIVVGDACTDDSEAVVNAFGDLRIRFVNLPNNVGEQSGPNNEGVRLARGEYIAFLNHDDLWFSDHLQRALNHLLDTRSDFVWSLGVAMWPDGTPKLMGSSASLQYEPHVWAPASSWLMRRGALDRVGPWRSAWTCYAIPSHDWLYRAWKENLSMQLLPHVTLLAIQSGNRPNSYRDRQYLEHTHLFDAMKLPHYRERIVTAIAHECHATLYGLPQRSDIKLVRRKLLFTLCRLFNANPGAVANRLRWGRKGEQINILRRLRGLGNYEPRSNRDL